MSPPTGRAAPAHEASTSTARPRAARAPSLANRNDAAPLRRLQGALGNHAIARMLTEESRAAEAARRSPARPLQAAARADMEARFGADLGPVRVHTDPAACDAFGAEAYTVGEHIVFNAGAYAPHRQTGHALLAHELIHVLQQRQGAGASSQAGLEGEARRISRAVASGAEPVAVRERGHAGLARQENPDPPTPKIADTQTEDGRRAISIDGVTVLRYTPAENEADLTTGTYWSSRDPKTIYLGVRRLSTTDVRVDQEGLATLESRGFTVIKDFRTIPAQVGERPGPSLDRIWTPEPLTTPQPPARPPSPRAKPTATTPAIPAPDRPPPEAKPPEAKPPEAKPPEAKPPAEKPPAEKPPAEKLPVVNPDGGAQAGPQAGPQAGTGAPPQPQAVPAQQPAGAQADAGVAADVPALSDLEARARTVRSNLKSFTFNISWAQDITDAFMGLTPADFQRLQELLGDHDMDDAFDQLTPFMATLIGTYGPVTKGSEKLNAKRVEFIVDTRDWGSVKETFYSWMFETMSIGDITLVVRQLGAQKRLRETIFTVTGLAESLVKRGVDPTAFNEEQTTWSEGAQRGLAHVWTAAWASTIFASGPSNEYSYLPANYQESYSSNLQKDFLKAFEPANAARGMASNVTLGLSDIPVGIYAAGDATVHGTIDLWDGKTGDAAEKFTPVVMMILMALAGRAAGKLATAPALEESALLETRMPPGAGPLPGGGAGPILYEVRSLGKTAEGLDRYLVRDASGELAEMTVDLEKRTIRATHLATGDVVTYENGQISRGPAGLLPPGAGAGGVADEIQPIRAAQTAPPMKPASLPENVTPAGDLDKTPAVRPAAGPVNLPLPSTPRTAAADLRVTQARDALAAATKTASAQRDAVLAAQQDLDAARALKTEAGRLASARDLVREQQAILGAAQAALRPISASEALAIADYAQVLEAQKQIVGLEGEVARLESELGQQLNPPGGFSREARLAGRRPWITPTWNQPGGLAYYALTAQLDTARTRLADWVRDLTVSLGDQVAAATPGPAARPAALSNARSLSSEALHPVNGAPIDVTTGMPMRTADWATDHVMSRTEIASDPRFPRLSPMKRLEILLNVPENYLPFTREANSSKGIQSVEEWIAAREKTNPISESMKQALREADQRARAAIETFFRDNEGK